MATTPEIEAPGKTTYESIDVASLIEAVEPVTETIQNDDDELVSRTYLLPPGWTAHKQDMADVLNDEAHPRRSKGTLHVESAVGLITATEQRRLDGKEPVLYGNERALQLISVLNDPQDGEADWADYRIVAQLTRTPEWEAWRNGQGLRSQEEFAEFIEDHLEDIADPPAADMLELAQTFHAHTEARFQRATRLDTGRVSLVYDEEQTASAGADQQIQIPREFTIAVRPFAGCDRFQVKARLRYRIGRGDLQLGWVLNRPEDVERTVFNEQLAEAADALDVTAIRGCP